MPEKPSLPFQTFLHPVPMDWEPGFHGLQTCTTLCALLGLASQRSLLGSYHPFMSKRSARTALSPYLLEFDAHNVSGSTPDGWLRGKEKFSESNIRQDNKAWSKPWDLTRKSSCEDIGNISSDHKRTIFKRRFTVCVDFWPVVKLLCALSIEHPNRFCKPVMIHIMTFFQPINVQRL